MHLFLAFYSISLLPAQAMQDRIVARFTVGSDNTYHSVFCDDDELYDIYTDGVDIKITDTRITPNRYEIYYDNNLLTTCGSVQVGPPYRALNQHEYFDFTSHLISSFFPEVVRNLTFPLVPGTSVSWKIGSNDYCRATFDVAIPDDYGPRVRMMAYQILPGSLPQKWTQLYGAYASADHYTRPERTELYEPVVLTPENLLPHMQHIGVDLEWRVMFLAAQLFELRRVCGTLDFGDRISE